MNPFLSILIPTKNRAAYLKYAIQSAINIPAEDIEIIVSENFSSDNSLEVCNSFSDSRLRVIRPSSPLPMHENWEFLLNESRGEWVTFIGDDDAVMPHCNNHLKYLCGKYPQAEAIASPRAYYYWDGCQEVYGTKVAGFSFDLHEHWRDSKKRLQHCLDGKLDYLYLPQMYSGGFHRRSLINRSFRAQNGQYFKSVTPDAYTALMACIHTYRYLETGVPMTWVGCSPHQLFKLDLGSSKNRKKDFYELLTDNSITVNKALLSDFEVYTFPLVFYECYISAFPLTSYSELSMDKVRSLYLDAVMKFRSKGNEVAVIKLSVDLGFEVPPQKNIKIWLLMSRLYKRVAGRIINICSRALNAINSSDQASLNIPVFSYSSHSHQDHPDILSCDSLLAEGYSRWLKKISLNE